jgi:hypothetical protein
MDDKLYTRTAGCLSELPLNVNPHLSGGFFQMDFEHGTPDRLSLSKA